MKNYDFILKFNALGTELEKTKEKSSKIIKNMQCYAVND